jgi:hypothetical protein
MGGYERAFLFKNEQWIYPWFHESEEFGVFGRRKALRLCFGLHSYQRGVVGSIIRVWESLAQEGCRHLQHNSASLGLVPAYNQ